MIRHYIIMSSSYTDGTRIALDFVDISSTGIKKIVDEIRTRCGEAVPIAMHLIETESTEWKSVSDYDPFFEDVELIKSVSEFSEKINRGRVLSGLDVAVYILTRIQCTHLKLERLVCCAYEDYFRTYSEPLFIDEIYASEFGMVVGSVYKAVEQSGLQSVESILRTNVKELPARSRILFARNGGRKLEFIDKTIVANTKILPIAFKR